MSCVFYNIFASLLYSGCDFQFMYMKIPNVECFPLLYYIFIICLIDFYWSNKWDSFEEIICSWIVFFCRFSFYSFIYFQQKGNSQKSRNYRVEIWIFFLLCFFCLLLNFLINFFEFEDLCFWNGKSAKYFLPSCKIFPRTLFRNKFACGIGLKDVFLFESQCSLEIEIEVLNLDNVRLCL